MTWPIASSLFVLLLVLASWQRRLDRAGRARTVERIREARFLGADRPVGQHPQIEPLLCIGCASCAKACPEDGVIAMVDGIAHVVQAAKCIGHGLCEEACPVGALEVGLGDLSRRTDIPVLSEELESTVPGLFIAGELGGLALIRNAVRQGVHAVDAVARRLAEERAAADAVDLLVVGAGPCGLAAAMRAQELGMGYRVIDMSDVGGTIRKYPRRKLVLTQPVELPLDERIKRREYVKEDLVEIWDSILERHRIEVESGVRLLGIERRDGVFEADTSAGPVAARYVILALGRRGTPRKLEVPGEERETVLYQLIDAATYRDQDLLVVGGGDSAVEAAMALANQPGNRVTLSYRKSAFFRIKTRNEERIKEYAAARRIQVIFGSEIERFEPGEVALRVDGSTHAIPNDYAFVFAGGEPPYPLLQAAGVAFNREEARA